MFSPQITVSNMCIVIFTLGIKYSSLYLCVMSITQREPRSSDMGEVIVNDSRDPSCISSPVSKL